jgi:hypothetical protein
MRLYMGGYLKRSTEDRLSSPLHVLVLGIFPSVKYLPLSWWNRHWADHKKGVPRVFPTRCFLKGPCSRWDLVCVLWQTILGQTILLYPPASGSWSTRWLWGQQANSTSFTLAQLLHGSSVGQLAPVHQLVLPGYYKELVKSLWPLGWTSGVVP